MVDEVGRGLGHASGIAGGTDGAAHNRRRRPGDHVRTPHSALAQSRGRGYRIRDSGETRARCRLAWTALPVVLTERTESLEMFLHHLLPRCLGGTSTGVEARSIVLGRFGGHLEVRTEDRDKL
jgi:hypothetical protein